MSRDSAIGGWHSPDLSIPFNELPIGALFTPSMFHVNPLMQKVDEDRWTRIKMDGEFGTGFAGRSCTYRYYQVEWIPMHNVPTDTGPDFMHKLLDRTGIPVVPCAT